MLVTVLCLSGPDSLCQRSHARKVSCKMRDEYAHLRDGPYAQAVSRNERKDTTAGQQNVPSTTARPSTALALLERTETVNSETEAARRAREVGTSLPTYTSTDVTDGDRVHSYVAMKLPLSPARLVDNLDHSFEINK
jgi:hypothetical protein